MMKTVNITTEFAGAESYVNVVEGEDSTLKVNETGKHIYCLTCGFVPKETLVLEALNVGATEGLRSWLQEREHYVKAEDKVLLCQNCLEELEARDEEIVD